MSKEFLDLLSSRPEIVPEIDTEGMNLVELEALKFEVEHDRQVPLTFEKAAWYVDLPVFKGERSVVPGHVQFLYDEMQAGRFNTLLVILAACRLGDTIYKINGQHTCWARSEMPMGWSPMVREILFKVGTEDQLRQLYSVFDRNKSRSEAHATIVQLVGDKEIGALTQTLVKRLAMGFKYWLMPQFADYRRVSVHEISELIKKEHHQLFMQVANIVSEKMEASEFKRQSVIAAVFETASRDAEEAKKFWQSVADGLGLDTKEDPRWQLRKYLQNTTVQWTSGKNKTVTDAETVYKICIQAWNKHRKGETVTVLKATKERRRAC
jgi:hypothetical protein